MIPGHPQPNVPMSPRTYIGPFGRILPVSEGAEPESLTRSSDEERSSFQLPQPTLNFGSDSQFGVTDPTRYNTSSLTRRVSDTRFPHGEQPRQASTSGDTLPPVRQLLTPGTQPSIPASPYSSKHSPGSSVGKSSFASSHQSSMPEPISETFINPHASFQPSKTASLVLNAPSLPQTGNFHTSAAIHHSTPYQAVQQAPVNYSSYAGIAPRTSYPVPHHPTHPQAQAPNLSPSHYPGYQPQQDLPMNPRAQYFSEFPGAYPFAGHSGPLSTQPLQSSPNRLKPGPRVLREDVLPGEGPVWVYEDGTTCPKMIDGEQVNAEWGITKAGKPRKRLAIACTSCREKKIKCEPAEPRCIQCEKFGKECTFTTA